MISFKKINKKLCSKLTAFTLVTTMAATVLPSKEIYAEDNTCPMYEEMVTYNTNSGDFIVKRFYDNSIEVEQMNTANKLTISNKGEVTLITDNGTSCSREVFDIKNFNPGKLDIDTACINDKDLAKCAKNLEKYFNSNDYEDKTYFNKYNLESIYDSKHNLNYEEVENITKNQYNDTYIKYIDDLNINGADIKSSAAIALPLTLTGAISSSSTATLAPVVALSSTQVVLLAIALAGVTLTNTLIEDSMTMPADDIALSDYDEIGFINPAMAKNLGAVPYSKVQTDIENMFNDLDPDNDYFIAYIVKSSDSEGNMITNLYIELASAMSKQRAQQIVLDNTNLNKNIYTLSPKDAKDLIISVGGIPGPSNNNSKYERRAECHAFKRSFEQFDPVTNLYNVAKLKYADRLTQGTQFWHFHFFGKKFLNEWDKEPEYKYIHIFFGLPMHISQKEVDKYNGTNENVAKAKIGKLLDDAQDNLDKIKKIMK